MKSSTHILNGMKIGFFGKGGAGKTTLCILLAEALRHRGYEVYILDADSTNIGMGDALGLERTPPALIEAFGGMVFSGGRVTCPVDDPTPLPDAEQSLDRLAEYTCETKEGIHYLSAGKIGHRPPGAGCDGPIAKIAEEMIAGELEGAS